MTLLFIEPTTFWAGIITVVTALSSVIIFLFKRLEIIQKRELKEKLSENKELKSKNEQLEALLNKLQARVHDLEVKLATAKVEYVTLFSTVNNSPLPQWVKKPDGTLIWCNDAYEQLILLPFNRVKEDYIGKTDADFWSTVSTSFSPTDFSYADDYVIRTGETYDAVERIPLPDNTSVECRVIKYPKRLYSTRQTLAVAGILIPPNLTQIKP